MVIMSMSVVSPVEVAAAGDVARRPERAGEDLLTGGQTWQPKRGQGI